MIEIKQNTTDQNKVEEERNLEFQNKVDAVCMYVINRLDKSACAEIDATESYYRHDRFTYDGKMINSVAASDFDVTNRIMEAVCKLFSEKGYFCYYQDCRDWRGAWDTYIIMKCSMSEDDCRYSKSTLLR